MPYLFLIPSAIFFILFVAWPIYKVVELSFYQTNFITTKFVGFQNYIDSFSNEMFLSSIKNSIFYMILLIAGMLFVSLSISLIIFKLSKKWHDISRILLYIPVLSGGIIIAQVWKWIFSNEGVANWLLSLFNIPSVNWFTQGFTAIPIVILVVVVSSFGSHVIIILSSLLSIDKGIFEAAMIDGANARQIRNKITLPLLAPTIALVALLSMIASLQIFETIYALVPQEYAYTPTFSIYTLGFKFSKWGMASAQSVMLLLVTVALSIIKKKVEKQQ